VAGTAADAVQCVVAQRLSGPRRWAREALLRRGFVEGVEGWCFESDDVVVTAWEGITGIDLRGPTVASSAPSLFEREGHDDPWVGSSAHVPSGDPAFDALVLAEHPDPDEGLGWLTQPRRQAAQRVVEGGGYLLSRRWQQRLPYGDVEEIEDGLDAFVGACHAFAVPPDRAPRIALHTLTLDPCPGVRLQAMERLIARGELPVSVGRRMEMESEEDVQIALIAAGGGRAVRLATHIMLCGAKRGQAAIALARIVRRDPYAAEAVDGVAEDLLVECLLDALSRSDLVLDAAAALRNLYLPQLPRLLHERFGERPPPRVEALRWEMVCRYRLAWGDTWPAAVLRPPSER
jgi:hypothetical protein